MDQMFKFSKLYSEFPLYLPIVIGRQKEKIGQKSNYIIMTHPCNLPI